VSKLKTIRGVQFTAASMTAVRIAASPHCNNAWTPRGEWATYANRIRSTFPRLDRVQPSKREVALLIKHNPPRKEAAKGGLKSFILVLIYSHYSVHALVNAWQYIPFAHVGFAGPRKTGFFLMLRRLGKRRILEHC
jgi:hypothetical protein